MFKSNYCGWSKKNVLLLTEKKPTVTQAQAAFFSLHRLPTPSNHHNWPAETKSCERILYLSLCSCSFARFVILEAYDVLVNYWNILCHHSKLPLLNIYKCISVYSLALRTASTSYLTPVQLVLKSKLWVTVFWSIFGLQNFAQEQMSLFWFSFPNFWGEPGLSEESHGK